VKEGMLTKLSQIASGEGEVSQSLTQIAQQTATGNVGEVNQDITQVAEQVAEGGDVSQTLVQAAEQTVD
jgi:methyl-accepting chemotaxis protein